MACKGVFIAGLEARFLSDKEGQSKEMSELVE
jgi:hypothetical protein